MKHYLATLMTVGFGFLAACSSAPADDESEVSIAREELVAAHAPATPGSRDLVQAQCVGAYKTCLACTTCVDEAAKSLAKAGKINHRDVHDVEDSFETACKNKCIPTTCAIAGATCGDISDGCGNTLNCGAACGGGGGTGGPNLLRCFCGDGTSTDVCAALDCASSAEQDAICGPACANNGGEAGTACFDVDPVCAK